MNSQSNKVPPGGQAHAHWGAATRDADGVCVICRAKADEYHHETCDLYVNPNHEHVHWAPS